ncbi:MAG: tetratricopeptide repeat protein [Bdellovibrionaceae bacterium]|nr:tetratricopeptide repeat protein [Pseudobdellovibrionaceae bacterium]MBX3033199.1 tetratricopeptide repeat protein [Pseudobdellovibrionaceae bacterium]
MRHFFLKTGIVLFSFPLMVAAKPSKSQKNDVLSREALVIELTGKDESKMSDIDLYAEIAAAYQGQDAVGLRRTLKTFLARHPKSSFADNALYLAGRQSLERREYAEALRYFQRLINDYPRSNRVVAAQFAKAMAYKKMHLEAEARKAFRDVIQKYPGSPESFRADSEMRLLN